MKGKSVKQIKKEMRELIKKAADKGCLGWYLRMIKERSYAS